ncbi:MAG: biotin--[acetyl-CoA-carboxylase] ligase [Burkholderiaceae bacterium]
MTNDVSHPDLQALLSTGFNRVERIDETGSTNTDLLAMPFTGQAQAAALRWANHQTAGRGRRGQPWLDEQGASLTFSVAFEYPTDVLRQTPLSAFTLVAGTSVLHALTRVVPGLGERLGLKWPNDVLLDGAKLAGILAEASQQAGISRLVIGCGLNLRLPAKLQQQPTALPAIGLLQANGQWPDDQSQKLVATIAGCLMNDFAEFVFKGFEPFRMAWESVNGFAGQPVVLSQDGKIIADGVCRGVDASGALQIESAGIIKGYSIGVLSARMRAGPDDTGKQAAPEPRL